jgi:uncharacterized protein YdaU (DUF1376 family)
MTATQDDPARLPWLKLYVGDELAEMATFTGEEQGLHLVMKVRSWSAGPLPASLPELKRVLAYDARTLRKCFKAVSKLWVVTPAGLVCPALERQRAEAAENAGKAREKARTAALARHGKAPARSTAPSSGAPCLEHAIPDPEPEPEEDVLLPSSHQTQHHQLDPPDARASLAPTSGCDRGSNGSPLPAAFSLTTGRLGTILTHKPDADPEVVFRKFLRWADGKRSANWDLAFQSFVLREIVGEEQRASAKARDRSRAAASIVEILQRSRP